jgi:hypothetical protein
MIVSDTQGRARDFLFDEAGLMTRQAGGNGLYKIGQYGIEKIFVTGDDKAEFICYENGRVVRMPLKQPPFVPDTHSLMASLVRLVNLNLSHIHGSMLKLRELASESISRIATR